MPSISSPSANPSGATTASAPGESSAAPVPEHVAESAQRLDRLAWWLDDSIRLPGGYRIGLDGVVGLIPGIGDIAGLAASAFVVFEARRLGISKRVLAKMTGNVLLETLVGTVPLVGDLFDFAFKANRRNVNLIREQLALTKPRKRSDSPGER